MIPCWAAAITLVSSAEVLFQPVLTFGLTHDGNTAIIGNPTSQGDNVAVVGAELPVSRVTHDSSLSFSYRPQYIAYAEQSDLNYFDQSASLSFETTSSRTSHYSIGLSAYRSDQQGVRSSDADTGVTFVPRNTTTHVALAVHGEHQGRRNLFDWEVHGGLDDHGQLVAPNPGTQCTTAVECNDSNDATIDTCVNGSCHYEYRPELQLQDAITAGALASWRYQLSAKSSLGIGFLVDLIFYDQIPDVAVETLGVVGEHTFSRYTSLSYALGGSVTTSEGSNATSGAANVTLSRKITEVSSLSAGIRQGVSHGTSIGGVSLDSGAYVDYHREVHGPGITGSVTAAYWRREPVSGVQSTQLTTNTFSGAGSVGWVFNRYLSLNLTDSYSYQTSAEASGLDTQYNTLGVNLRWIIRGAEERGRATPSGAAPPPSH